MTDPIYEHSATEQGRYELLHGLILQLDSRVKILEELLRGQEQRLQAQEAHHRHYMESVHTLRVHFDGELVDIKQTHRQVVTHLGDLTSLVQKLNTLIREENGTPSMLSRQRQVEAWMTTHQQAHSGTQDRWWRLGLDIAKWLIIAALGSLSVVHLLMRR